MHDPLARLADGGRGLPTPPSVGGAYDPVRVIGSIAHVAVQVPIVDGHLGMRVRFGRELTTTDGVRSAELCALNVLAQIDRAGGLDRVLGLNHFDAKLCSDPP